jgi:hypothetical protein
MQSLSGHFLRKIMRSRATHASRRNEPMPVAELHARCDQWTCRITTRSTSTQSAAHAPRQTQNGAAGVHRVRSSEREQGRQARQERGG